MTIEIGFYSMRLKNFNHSSQIVYIKINATLIEGGEDIIEVYLPVIICIEHILRGRVGSVGSVCIHDVFPFEVVAIDLRETTKAASINLLACIFCVADKLAFKRV